MAYSNWGAFVYCNGKRREDKEDVGVFDTDEASCPRGFRIWANILKNREKYPNESNPWYTHSHHAVLGDNDVRLCGYKDSAELWVCRDGKPEKIELDCDAEDEVSDEVSVNDKTWKYTYALGDTMVDLNLEEPNGTSWFATCGYQYGAGHME
jgi:hypothetical protein